MRRSNFTTASLLIFIILLQGFYSGCAKNPVTHRYEVTLMGAKEESRIGEEQDEAVRKLYGEYENEDLQKYVEALGSKLVESAHPRPLTYHFTVIDSAEINAFALPGGYIYITRGILAQCNSEAELAGVIGHEIGHVTARHHSQKQVRGMGLQIGSLLTTVFLGEVGIYLQRYIDLLFVGVYQSFGRQAELQADELGQSYTFDAGWDPRGSTQFLKTLNSLEKGRDRTVFHGFFASHPETYERVQKSQLRGETMVEGEEPGKQEKNKFLKMLDGMPYGNRPELGEFEDSLYRNAESGIAIRFPEDWESLSSQGTVVSRRPDTSYFMQLITAQPKDETYLEHVTSREDYFIKLRELAEKFEAQKRWRRDSEKRIVVHEIPTFVATYQFQTYLGRFYKVKAHFMIVEKNLHILMAFAPVNQIHLAEYYFRQVFQNVRRLDEAEVEELQPRKLQIYEVKENDTFEMISERYYGTTEKARDIARLNGYISNLYPPPGDLLKIIVRCKKTEPSS
jgi:predicted Zn-dependent protease